MYKIQREKSETFTYNVKKYTVCFQIFVYQEMFKKKKMLNVFGGEGKENMLCITAED